MFKYICHHSTLKYKRTYTNWNSVLGFISCIMYFTPLAENQVGILSQISYEICSNKSKY